MSSILAKEKGAFFVFLKMLRFSLVFSCFLAFSKILKTRYSPHQPSESESVRLFLSVTRGRRTTPALISMRLEASVPGVVAYLSER